jgi:hypothetical protein
MTRPFFSMYGPVLQPKPEIMLVPIIPKQYVSVLAKLGKKSWTLVSWIWHPFTADYNDWLGVLNICLNYCQNVLFSLFLPLVWSSYFVLFHSCGMRSFLAYVKKMKVDFSNHQPSVCACVSACACICLSVCPPQITFEPVGGFSWNLEVWCCR